MTSSGPLSFGYVHIFKHTADLRRFLCVLMWGWVKLAIWTCTIIAGESPSSYTIAFGTRRLIPSQACNMPVSYGLYKRLSVKSPCLGCKDTSMCLPVSKWFQSPSWTGLYIISCYIMLYSIHHWVRHYTPPSPVGKRDADPSTSSLLAVFAGYFLVI